jgi:hypothetical protein
LKDTGSPGIRLKAGRQQVSVAIATNHIIRHGMQLCDIAPGPCNQSVAKRSML